MEYEFWVRNFKHWKYKGGNTYDLQTIYLIRKESMMNIVPNINLVTNIGWDVEASNTNPSVGDSNAATKFGNIPSFELESIVHPKILDISDKHDIMWFRDHFQKKSALSYRIRWAFGPIYRKLFK